MNPFEIHTIPPNQDDIEQLGTKEKFWFIYSSKNDEKWLFKYSRSNTGEHWSEKVAEQICEVLGIPHVEYQLAVCNGRFGVITKNIIPEKSRMVMGNEVLNLLDPENYPDTPKFGKTFAPVKEHTLARLEQCFAQMHLLPPAKIRSLDALDVFCGYLMLDVLIGNQDRHHENWAILIDDESDTRTLCPTYDHAASLGRELLDEKRTFMLHTLDTNQQIPAFVKRARSALFGHETQQKPLLTMDAFLAAVARRPLAKNHWLGMLRDLSQDKIATILKCVPDSCISDDARNFAIEMILENKKRLLHYENE